MRGTVGRRADGQHVARPAPDWLPDGFSCWWLFLSRRLRPDDGGQRLRQLLQAFQAPEDAATAKANLFQAFVEVALVPEILAQDWALTAVTDALPQYAAMRLLRALPNGVR